VVPDGRIDVIFQLGTAPSGQIENPGPAYVVGPMLEAKRVQYEGPTLTIGARFAPGAAAALVAPPPAQLIDRAVALQDLWHDVPALVDSLASARDDSERIVRLERALEQRARPGLTLDRAALAMEQSAGAIRIADLARDAGVSERQLERRFRARVGLTPRMARRIARFLRATHILSRNPDTPWQDMLLACGFYDQPHLIHEFRTFAGVTPTQFADEQRVGLIQDETPASPEIVLAQVIPSPRRRSA